MVVAFDAVGPTSAGTSATATTTLSWSHTCAGTNRYVVVGVAMGQSPDTGRTLSATFGGASMPSIGSVHSGGGTDGLVQMFGLINPAVGASTVTVTASGTTDTLSGGSISFTGVHQTTPVGTAATASPTATSVSVSVDATTVGNMVVDAACYGSGVGITSSTQTNRWKKNVNGNTAAGNSAGSTAAAGGSVSMGYSAANSDGWGLVAVEVKAAATVTTGDAALAGTGTVTAAGFAARPASATLTGTAALTAAPATTGASAATLAGTAALTSAGFAARPSAATLAATATLTTAGSAAGPAGAAIAAAATLTAGGSRQALAVAAMAGTAAVTAVGALPGPPSATLAAAVASVAAAARTLPAAAVAAATAAIGAAAGGTAKAFFKKTGAAAGVVTLIRGPGGVPKAAPRFVNRSGTASQIT